MLLHVLENVLMPMWLIYLFSKDLLCISEVPSIVLACGDTAINETNMTRGPKELPGRGQGSKVSKIM